MFKKILTIFFIAILMFTIGGIGLAQNESNPGSIYKEGDYDFNGKIDWSTHMGSELTGAQQKVIISGDGNLQKSDTSEVRIGRLIVDEEILWQTHPKAMEKLSLLSVIKLGAPAATETQTDQIYAIYLQAARNQTGYLKQTFVGTHGEGLIDSFVMDMESLITEGITKRYISLSGEISKAYLIDDLSVIGYASISEYLEFYDEIVPLELSTIQWHDLF
jgi:hypothetical protein